MANDRQVVTADGAPAAIGPYSHAASAGGLLFCSGQIPLDPASGELVGETPGEQARQCLQRTGSFKIRGALNKLTVLGAEGCARGVMAASAGNHAQALALAARARGVPCEVYMPDHAPIAKVEGAEGLGATVVLGGDSVDDCLVAARAQAQASGMAFVHPFDDLDVIAGQGTLGLELLDDVPDLAKVVVPVGGGGLASGVAIAVKSGRPEVEVVGVQVDSVAAYPESLRRGEPVEVAAGLTIADG